MQRFVIVFVLISFVACKETPKETSLEINEEIPVKEVIDSKYPEALTKIFDTHGGLAMWKSKRTLSYTMPKETGNETQTVDLYSRKEKIEMSEVSMGFNGENVWLLDEDETYNGDPMFYKNLMFYFYAMPFVLADDGINYGNTEPLEYKGRTYPGIRISYDGGVGVSPKDEYFIHYNPKTYQMVWLGYTVTYRSGEKSDNIKWIRYNDWTDVNGLLLPKSLTWHNYEGRKIMEARDPLQFQDISLSNIPKPDTFYQMPKNAKVVTKQ